MKDLDFDELDKAVNTLMAGVPKDKTSDLMAEKTLDITPSDTSPGVSSLGVSEPTTPPSLPSASLDRSTVSPSTPPAMLRPSSARAPLPAVRRAGRFMDVVPPAAKKPESPSVSRVTAEVPKLMEGASPVAALTATTSAGAASLNPPATSGIGSVSPKDDKVSLGVTPASEAPRADWPDPLELSGFDKEDTASTAQPPADTASSVESVGSSTLPPLTSPFLPDAKVEKRPLGGAGGGTLPDSVAAVVAPVIMKDELPATLEDTKSLLPDELHRDLIAIESDTTEPEAVVSPVEPTSPGVAEAPAAPSPVEAAPTGSASIPQQYREMPSSGSKESGAIYDTATYHQPLNHPAKQKSGWMWVIWIVLILVLGAGGGAALYFLRII